MNEFFLEKKRLYEWHSGFRKDHPTGPSLIFNTEKISKGFGKKQLTEMI